MRSTIASGLLALARLSLNLALVLAPLRLNLFRWAREFPPIYYAYTDFVLTPVDITLVLILITWGGSFIWQPRQLKWGPLFLSLPLAGVTLFSLGSIPFSADPTLSLYHNAHLLILGGLYLYLVNELKTLDTIQWGLALFLLSQASIGIAQVLTQKSLGLTALGEWTLDPTWNGVSVVWVEGVRLLRAYGLTDHPNILGGGLSFGLSLLLTLLAQTSPNRRWAAAGIATLTLIALLFTFSRAAWLALLAALMLNCILLFYKRHTTSLKSWLSFFIMGTIVLLPFIWAYSPALGVRLNIDQSFALVDLEKQSIGERELLNNVANQLFAQHALVGVGLGAFPLAFRNNFPTWQLNYQPAHLVLLDVAAEIGLFGALSYAATLTFPWLIMWIQRRRILTPTLIGLSGVLAGLTLIGFFDYYTWSLAAGRFWQWLLWGLWAAHYQLAQHPPTHPTHD